LSYGVASLVGYSRMETDAHWLSDVTASAFIGIGVAKEVAKLDRARHGITFAPRVGPDGWSVQVAKSF
jgi:membrane-associated phospholipid phosphatase